MFDYHRKCGLSHSKPWNVKLKKEKGKKRIRDLTTKDKICLYLASRFIAVITTEALSSAKHIESSFKLIKRSRNSWLQSTNIRVHIIHPTLDIHHHEFNMTKFTLDWNASYHRSADNPNLATVNFIWRFFNFSLYFKKESIIALLLTSALSTLK